MRTSIFCICLICAWSICIFGYACIWRSACTYIGADGEIEPSGEFLTRKNFKCSVVLYFSCSCSKERRPSVRSVSNKLNSITLRERFIKKKKKLNKIVLPLHLPTSSKNYKKILFFPICRKMGQIFCRFVVFFSLFFPNLLVFLSLFISTLSLQ